MKRWMLWAVLPGLLAASPLVPYLLPQTAGADQALVVLSGSMEPSFRPGDIVLIDAVDHEDIQVGDVITFHSHPGSDVTYTHRVIEIIEDERGRLLKTQGDANESPDPMLVAESMVVGRHEGTIPWYGNVVVHMNGQLAYLAMAVVSLLLVAIELPGLLAGVAEPRTVFSPVEARATPEAGADPDVPSASRRFEVLAR